MPTAKQSIESSPQYLTLTSYTNFLSTDLNTLTTLTSSITPTTPTTTISTYLETLWNSLLLLVSQTEWSSLTHQKLSLLLHRLQTHSSESSSYLGKTEVEPLPIYNDTEFSWSQLPDLNIYIRDWYNFSPPFSPSSTPLQGFTFSNQEWVNLNAFLATLTRTSLTSETPNNTPTDYSLYALWSLRSLEVETESLNTLDPADIQTAAVWIVIAKTEIYKLCKANTEYEGEIGRAHV